MSGGARLRLCQQGLWGSRFRGSVAQPFLRLIWSSFRGAKGQRRHGRCGFPWRCGVFEGSKASESRVRFARAEPRGCRVFPGTPCESRKRSETGAANSRKPWNSSWRESFVTDLRRSLAAKAGPARGGKPAANSAATERCSGIESNGKGATGFERGTESSKESLQRPLTKSHGRKRHEIRPRS